MIKTFVLVPIMLLSIGGEPQRSVPEAASEIQTSNRPINDQANEQQEDVGLVGFSGAAACQPLYGSELVSVGPVTGDPEKDTFARRVVAVACP